MLKAAAAYFKAMTWTDWEKPYTKPTMIIVYQPRFKSGSSQMQDTGISIIQQVLWHHTISLPMVHKTSFSNKCLSNLPTVTGRPLQNHSTRIVGSPMGSSRHSRWIFFPSLTGLGSERGCTKIGFDLEISSIWYCGSTNFDPSRCCVFSIAERCMLVVSILERTATQINCVQQTYSWLIINIYNTMGWSTLRSQTEDFTFKHIFRTSLYALLGSDVIL